MPIAPTYPGVYIEEVPSGVRTITGVATSVTAFLGRAARGPVDDPVSLSSFGDFERIFGGLDQDLPLGYAVRDFFLNGGSEAIVVRLFVRKGANDDGVAKGEFGAGAAPLQALKLKASSPGSWGESVHVAIDYDGLEGPEVAASFGVAENTLFNLRLEDKKTGAIEYFRSLSLIESRRRVDRILAQESRLARVQTKTDGAPDLPDKGLPGKVSVDDKKHLDGGNDGSTAELAAEAYAGSQTAKTGMFALEKADLFNLLCVPPDRPGGDVPEAFWPDAARYCKVRRAFLIVDAPAAWGRALDDVAGQVVKKLPDLGLQIEESRNAALFFPRLREADPQRGGSIQEFCACGAVAGVFARTDAQRGVWKAPAGTDATLTGVSGFQAVLTDAECGRLNPKGVNCLRSFPVYGKVIWGARTMRGDDQLSDDYKYVPVRRLALYIEESLFRGTKWVVFEPNDEPLWAQIRLNVGAFMHSLFRQGAFQGTSPREAYFVKCDKETTTQDDVNRGIVNILVGFAPLKPAEFVIIRIQQIAGQLAA